VSDFGTNPTFKNVDVNGDLNVDGDLTLTDITLTGDLTVSGTVDGRDISTDGTKLDGIEAGATTDQTDAQIRAAVEAATDSNVFTDADHTKLNGIEAGATTDQTASEIRALVESATDSNVFTDADHTKLNGIEASADVTDTTNVTSAGALMDSEVTNLSQVKSFDSSDYATAAQGTKADNALPKAGGAMTGAITTNSTFDGRDVATDGTKLDGIEASADVTDTANVTSAGALMDSEITNLAQVKAFDSSDYATAAQGTTADNALPKAGGTMTGGLTVQGTVAATAVTGDGSGLTNLPAGTAIGGNTGVSFNDNIKVKFGTSDDLQIYHDGSNSYVQNVGTGELRLLGTVTSDGLTVETTADNGAVIQAHDNSTTTYPLKVQNAAGSGRLEIGTYGINNNIDLKIQTADTNRINVDTNGDISFYEDTGSTAKLMWKASEEELRISQDQAVTLGSVGGTGTLPYVGFGTYWDGSKLRAHAGSYYGYALTTDRPNNKVSLQRYDSSGPVTGNITLAGNSVGIGIAAPDTIIHGAKDGGATLTLENTDTTIAANDLIGGIDFKGNDASEDGNEVLAYIRAKAVDATPDSYLSFGTLGNAGGVDDTVTERIRIDKSGNLLVGTTSIPATLTGTSTEVGIGFDGASGYGAFVRDGSVSLYANRLTSDGTIQEFRKDGTTVGSVSAYSSNLLIGTGNTNLRFFDSSKIILPRTASNGASNGVIDLGDSGNRFKDLHLSGTAYSGHILAGATAQIGTGSNLIKADGDTLALDVYTSTSTAGRDVFAVRSDIGGTETKVGVIEANGDFQSATNSYGSISDQSVKQDIVDANSQMEDVKNIRLRNYRLIDHVTAYGDDAKVHLGVVAQELEAENMDGLVSENADGVKGVRYSVMLLKALGALQETITMVEDLQAENTQIKARLTALEG
jgi:hypothetical protein